MVSQLDDVIWPPRYPVLVRDEHLRVVHIYVLYLALDLELVPEGLRYVRGLERPVKEVRRRHKPHQGHQLQRLRELAVLHDEPDSVHRDNDGHDCENQHDPLIDDDRALDGGLARLEKEEGRREDPDERYDPHYLTEVHRVVFEHQLQPEDGDHSRCHGVPEHEGLRLAGGTLLCVYLPEGPAEHIVLAYAFGDLLPARVVGLAEPPTQRAVAELLQVSGGDVSINTLRHRRRLSTYAINNLCQRVSRRRMAEV